MKATGFESTIAGREGREGRADGGEEGEEGENGNRITELAEWIIPEPMAVVRPCQWKLIETPLRMSTPPLRPPLIHSRRHT